MSFRKTWRTCRRPPAVRLRRCELPFGNTAALAFGGQCIAERTLPDYPIARIRTGQVHPRRRPDLDGRVPCRRGGRRTVAMTRAGTKIRRALRLVGWNTLFLVAGLALIGVVGEMYFRLRAPFLEVDASFAWSPTIGAIYTPNAEARWTNRLDFWTESRTNSLGFLDREPIGLERAAASCHIAMIGDSYVEARHVPIADKFHVRLEELAAEELRHLDIATSAFGIMDTGQVNQLAYYDEFARTLRPALLVLVFVDNDFVNNAPILDGLRRGVDPDRLIEVSATRGADGTITLRPPPSPFCGVPIGHHGLDFSTLVLARHGSPERTCLTLAKWLEIKTEAWFPADTDSELVAWVALLSRRSPATPRCSMDGGQRRGETSRSRSCTRRICHPSMEDGLDFTGFALDQFRERADRDGAALVILTSNYMGTRGDLDSTA